MRFLHTARWISFVSGRFARVDRTSRSAAASSLSVLGIALGVMTLIVSLSVMNGFQRGFIDAIMEISSYHLRVENVIDEDSFKSFCAKSPLINVATPFYEAQSLMVGRNGAQSASLVRAVPYDICIKDSEFAKQAEVYAGSFDLTEPNSIVLGSELARSLNAGVGSEVSLLALSGGNDVSLFSDTRVFTVTGLFFSGYSDINSSFSFISLDDGKKYFGKDAKKIYGLKLKKSNEDSFVARSISKVFPDYSTESWRSYNRTFFGALRIEKNMLMLLVILIFVVVAVNIYNAMRRIVFERREEIAVLSALGGEKKEVQAVFVLQGFSIGFKGALLGLVLGLFLSTNMESVFTFIAESQYWITYFFTMVFAPENAGFVRENPMFLLYARIPTKMIFSEVIFVVLFGIFSAVFASISASKGMTRLTVSEVFRND